MRVLLLLLLLVASGCASRVGPDGLAIGAPCADAFECVSGSFCLRGPAFPDGTCTTNCRNHDDCRGQSQCVDLESGVCLLSCSSDAECVREGYRCVTLDARDSLERVSVCAG